LPVTGLDRTPIAELTYNKDPSKHINIGWVSVKEQLLIGRLTEYVSELRLQIKQFSEQIKQAQNLSFQETGLNFVEWVLHFLEIDNFKVQSSKK